MKIIENKKLFGKVSIFDVIIILIGITVVIFAYRYLYASNTGKASNNYINTKFKVKLDNLPIGTSEHITIGDQIYDNETNVYVGKVIEFEVKEYKKIIENYDENKYVESTVPNRETIILTLETSVQDAQTDLITANNYYIKVGKELYVRGSSYAGGGYIIQIDRQEVK